MNKEIPWSTGYELRRVNVIQIARNAGKSDEEIEALLEELDV